MELWQLFCHELLVRIAAFKILPFSGNMGYTIVVCGMCQNVAKV